MREANPKPQRSNPSPPAGPPAQEVRPTPAMTRLAQQVAVDSPQIARMHPDQKLLFLWWVYRCIPAERLGGLQ
jgi:hypothetical protein